MLNVAAYNEELQNFVGFHELLLKRCLNSVFMPFDKPETIDDYLQKLDEYDWMLTTINLHLNSDVSITKIRHILFW